MTEQPIPPFSTKNPLTLTFSIFIRLHNLDENPSLKPILHLLALTITYELQIYVSLMNYFSSKCSQMFCYYNASHFLKISSNNLQLIGYRSSWYFFACACHFLLTKRPLNFKSATKSSKLITGSSSS